MMSGERLCIIFKPAYGKSAGDVSRQLGVLESIIADAGGQNFAVHPHDSAAFCFTLGDDVSAVDAEKIVLTINNLNDMDGRPLVDAEQGGLSKSTRAMPHAVLR